MNEAAPRRRPKSLLTSADNSNATPVVGCGYRNMDNYQRRILTHIAVTRPQQTAA